MGPVGEAYAGCRLRMCELALALDEERAGRRVDACPGWSVHDVLAHVTGVVDDALAGRLDGVTTDPWTAAQVEARRQVPTAEVAAAWCDKAPAFEALLDDVGDPGRQAVGGVVTHEHDLRGALRAPGARDSDAVHIGFGFIAPLLVSSASAHGVDLVVHPADGAPVGDPGAPAVLRGSSFELLRAMTGRRSMAQLRRLDLRGDAEALLPAFTFGPFRPAPHDLDE